MASMWLRFRELREGYAKSVTELDIDLSLFGAALVLYGLSQMN